MKLYLSLAAVVLLACVSSLAYADESSCLSDCYAQHPDAYSLPADCCGCCPNNGTCYGNRIAPQCCQAKQAWCGCISQRAACSGSIYGSSEPVQPFGTCYDPSPSAGVCCYYPAPNVWMVCPEGTTCCGGLNYNPGSITCCYANEECVINATTTMPSCVAKPTTTGTPSSTVGTTGLLTSATSGSTTGNPIPATTTGSQPSTTGSQSTTSSECKERWCTTSDTSSSTSGNTIPTPATTTGNSDCKERWCTSSDSTTSVPPTPASTTGKPDCKERWCTSSDTSSSTTGIPVPPTPQTTGFDMTTGDMTTGYEMSTGYTTGETSESSSTTGILMTNPGTPVTGTVMSTTGQNDQSSDSVRTIASAVAVVVSVCIAAFN